MFKCSMKKCFILIVLLFILYNFGDLLNFKNENSTTTSKQETKFKRVFQFEFEKSGLNRSGLINLTLNIFVETSDNKTKLVECRPLHSILNISMSEKCINFSQLAYMDNTKFNEPIVYKMYPQDIPMDAVLERVKSGLAVAQEPIFNFKVNALRVPKNVCFVSRSGNEIQKYDLVIVVKTAIWNFENRARIRKMLHHHKYNESFRWGLVFSVGIPRRHGSNRFDRDGIPFYLHSISGSKLQEYYGKYNQLKEKLSQEMNEFDDFVQGDFEDTYYNLTRKASFNLRWAAAFCANVTPTVLIIDDDVKIDVDMMINFFKYDEPKDKTNILAGQIMLNGEIYRSQSSIWFGSKQNLPWKAHTPYLNGPAMFIGSNRLLNLAIAGAFTKEFRLDDVWLGLVFMKLNITTSHIINIAPNGMFTLVPSKYV